eukprot:2828132-Pyramimonas_sp.AAC.1
MVAGVPRSTVGARVRGFGLRRTRERNQSTIRAFELCFGAGLLSELPRVRAQARPGAQSERSGSARSRIRRA